MREKKRQVKNWVGIKTHSDYDSMLISGPTLANRPYSDNSWWTNWLASVAGNDTVPDQYAYHLEGGTTEAGNDLQERT